MNADLGARYVACKGWAVLDMMRGHDSEHDDYVSVVNGGGEDVLVVALKASRPTLKSMEWRKAADFRPDTADNATLGCIEHGLLPEAWSGCVIEVSRWTSDGRTMAGVRIREQGLAGLRPPLFSCVAPLAEALLAALEASPANQEGA